MILQPAGKEELTLSLRSAHVSRVKLDGVDLSAMKRILRHTPEDMTAKVEAGLTLGEFQRTLASRGQWLPIDPPFPDSLTIGALISNNASGPRRFGFGTVRDHLIGLEVALADGRLVKSGGNVVKNVAGYDLMKLFVGAGESLGFAVEASFKLLPLPEKEMFLRMQCRSLADADRAIESVMESELTPVVFDLHRLLPVSASSLLSLTLGFAGTREEVDWQVGRAMNIGKLEPTTLDYDSQFWAAAGTKARHASVLPSRLIETIHALGDEPFLARAGNGVIYHRGPRTSPKADLPLKLMRRVKETFDPNQILPGIPT